MTKHSCSITWTDFRMLHPLCKVQTGNSGKFSYTTESDERNKLVNINCVDKELLDFFLVRHVYPVIEKAAACYVHRSSAGRLLSLFPIFTYLAPRDTDAEMLKKYEGELDSEAGNELDVYDAVPSTLGESQDEENLEFVQEDSEDSADLRPSQVVDFRAYFRDEAFSELPKSSTVLICDLKRANFFWEPLTIKNSVLYELADYGCCAGVANMHKGRYKPIYMVVLADGCYAFAVLDMDGYLSVDNRCIITQESFDEFLKKLREKWCQENPGGEYAELSEIEKQARLKDYQEQLNRSRARIKKEGTDDTVSPDRDLLVGKVQFFPARRQWTMFPVAYDQGRRFTLNDYVFNSGMLRVLYGDRVCKWTKETLQALEHAHDKILEARAEELILR